MNKENLYFEIFARNILEKYTGLDITNFRKHESPDWIDNINSIGIEVTRTAKGNQFWSELENVKKPISDEKIERFNKRFEKNGGRVISLDLAKTIGIKDTFGYNNNFVYILPCYNDDFSIVNQRISEKVKKLNKNYTAIKDNRLFIFSSIMFNDEIIKNEIESIQKIQKKYKCRFNIFYICILHELCIIDLNTKSFKRIPMSKEEFDKISFESADKAEKAQNSK